MKRSGTERTPGLSSRETHFEFLVLAAMLTLALPACHPKEKEKDKVIATEQGTIKVETKMLFVPHRGRRLLGQSRCNAVAAR
jgi:hypothetical protein